jgi:4-amino-4-deoxy-L-arabinose transferase-like glycosyltransferase
MNLHFSRLGDRGRYGLFALCFALFWLGVISYLSFNPPIDTAEQLTWSRHFDWGYYKHPPLTTLLLIPFVRLFGLHEWVPGLLGATLTLGAFYMLWDWIRGLQGARTAWITLFCLTSVSTYAYRLHYYNHDVVLMVTYLLAARLCWNVLVRGALKDWAWAGFALGLACLAKYQAALILPALALVALRFKLWQREGAVKGLVLATLCGLLVVMPHIVWLVHHDFLPFTYVQDTSLDRGQEGWAQMRHVGNWFLNQVQRVLGVGVMALLLWLGQKWTTLQDVTTSETTPATQWGFYLAALGWTPLVCMLLLGVSTQMYLQPHWMAPFFPLWVAWWACRPGTVRWFAKQPMRRIVLAYLVVQLILAYVSWGTSVRGGYWGGKRYNRDFQSQKAADQLQSLTRQDFPDGVPLVIGLSNIADVISLRLPNRPPVLVEGRLLYSPWLPAGLLQEKGGLLVVQNIHEVQGQLNAMQMGAQHCALRSLPTYGLHWCVIKAGTPAALH